MSEPLIQSFDFDADVWPWFASLASHPYAFWLDSSGSGAPRARYSFLGCDPYDVVRGGADILQRMEDVYRRQPERSPGPFPFMGGAVGVLSYDFGMELNRVVSRRALGESGVFGWYDVVLAIDHVGRRAHVISTGYPEKNPSLRTVRAAERQKDFLNILSRHPVHAPATPPTAVEIVSETTRDEYEGLVHHARDLIARGEIYQVNLSQKFFCERRLSQDIYLYRTLRTLSPSGFSSYFNAGDFTVLSSSPERFLYSDGRMIETIPMKGTRRRGATDEEDRRLKTDLIASAKDRAELLMITDLMRSDLGRVCEYGSIRVTQPRSLETYATVFQTTAAITGCLKAGLSPFETIASVFPAGSITGCPKIRSMQIIDELEPSPRGFYTGSMGYVGFDGAMDFNVLIRTIFGRKDQWSFHAGGGIVADSDPRREYEETLIKARAMAAALRKAH